MGARRLLSYPLSLAVVVAALIAATGGWIAWWNYRSGLANIRTLASGLFDQVARQTAGSTEAFLDRAPPAAAALAGIVAIDEGGPDALALRCLAVLRANEGFAWVSYSDRDGRFTGALRTKTGFRINRSSIVDGATVRREHEVAADGTLVPIRPVAATAYDPRTRPFYALAAAAPQGVWTPPYVFAGQLVPGITYALPHRAAGPGGELRGVFTIDFDLARLSDLARELRFSPGGRVVVLSGDIVLAHPTAPIVRPARGGGEP
ncbi:MAG: cache domain-containing protein, partial [Myxococcota bacterium]|nr:cache domain-containing protein [Myxococcota bacterium]